MPHPNAIDPKTGKRFGYVDPKKVTPVAVAKADLEQAERQATILARQLAAKQAQTSLMTFTKFTMPDPENINDVTKTRYRAAPFHEAVARVLERVESGEITQLIFCMPPRHGKTELATKRLAAWYSGKHPGHDIIVAAAGDDLAGDFGGDVRAIMQSPSYRQVFPNYRLRRGGTAKDNIQTVEGGRLIFAGRGGQINGRGANLLLIDDLYKDDKEARSQTIRDDAWNWFTRVALFRRMGKSLTVITMTRWHSDDIIGRLTDPENPNYSEEEAKAWKIIRLPGLAEEEDPLGRKPGEVLWPGSEFTVEKFAAARRRDPIGFEALVQQNPTVADGTLFRRENIRFYRTVGEEGGGIVRLPENLRLYGASDHAVATGQRNDRTCLLKVGVDQYGNIYLLDTLWARIKTDAAVEAMIDMGSDTLLWWAEKGHISKSIGPFLHKRMEERKTWVNIREVTPAVDKEQRAQAIAGLVARGKVFFPRDAHWTERAVNELLAFPQGNFDDFVDTLAYIGLGLKSQVYASPPKKVEDEPKFGSLAWLKRSEKWTAEESRRKAGGGF